MKKYILSQLTILALLLAGVFTSCDLSQRPNDYISLEESFKDLADAEKWDAGLYSTFRGKFGGAFILPQETQADMLNAHSAYGRLYGPFHGWEVKSNNDVLDQVYHSYYAALIDVNTILNTLPTLEVKTDDERKTIERYSGNAHLVRAFYHFNLVIRWGMRYNPATASQDLGIPLVTSFDPLVKVKRNTNEQVYTQILSDLDRAEELLAEVPTREGSDELTADLAKALRARVQLYMGDMAGALASAESLISSGTYPLIPPADGEKKEEEDPFVQMWHRDSGKEQIFQPHIDKPNELPTPTNLYGADLSTYTHHKNMKEGGKPGYQFNKPNFIPSAWVEEELFSNKNDRRARAYFEWGYTTVNQPENVYGPILVVAKFKGNPKYRDLESEHWGGYVPNSIQAPKPFRIAEQYLIAAEAAYETHDEAKARNYLNQLRQSRGLTEVQESGVTLRDAIRDERTRELAFEGFRLWDLRRWGLDVQRRKPQVQQGAVKTPYLSDEFAHDLHKSNDDPKFVWGIPLVEMKSNHNMVRNKGW